MTDKQAPLDERAKFEAYLREKFGKDSGWFLWVHGDSEHRYVYMQSEWEAWQARAGQQEQAVLSDLDRGLLEQALEAMEFAQATHGNLLLTNPPKQAWDHYGTAEKLTAAIAAIKAMKSDTEVFSSVGHATGKDLQAARAKRETRE